MTTTPSRPVLVAGSPASDTGPASVVVDNTPAAPVLDVVIPIYNEEAEIERCVRRLQAYLNTRVPYSARITIADNASTDRSLHIACRIAETNKAVRVVHLDAKGRGRALKAVWLDSDAEVVAYMDVDLSTDLNGLMPLVAPIISGHSDLAIGSRLAPQSRVVRGPKREFISRSYNLILRTAMGAQFSDAQCGFKAIRTSVARQVLPLVHDTGWFFDTELLVLAERVGLRISEVPVDWIDDPNSKVDIISTAREDLKGCWRVGRALASGELPVHQLRADIGREPIVAGVPSGLISQIVRFAVIGVICTVGFYLLYFLFKGNMSAQWANFVALAVTSAFGIVANRAFTFGVRGRVGVAAHYLQGIVIFIFSWAITAIALFAVHRWDPNASALLEGAVLIIANLTATVLRFVGLRWVFRDHHDGVAQHDGIEVRA